MAPIGGASGIGWDESSPSVSESAGLGASRIQSLETSIRQGLDAEHNWPSAGGNNVGYHRYGSARVYIGTQSQVSSSGSDGRLMQTSDTSRLFGVGSGGTSYIGGAQVISAGSFPGTVPQRHHWVEEFGTLTTDSGYTTVITFPNSGYSGQPYLYATSVQTAVTASSVIPIVIAQGASTFILGAVASGAYIVGQQLHWRSIGTRCL